MQRLNEAERERVMAKLAAMPLAPLPTREEWLDVLKQEIKQFTWQAARLARTDKRASGEATLRLSDLIALKTEAQSWGETLTLEQVMRIAELLD